LISSANIRTFFCFTKTIFVKNSSFLASAF